MSQSAIEFKRLIELQQTSHIQQPLLQLHQTAHSDSDSTDSFTVFPKLDTTPVEESDSTADGASHRPSTSHDEESVSIHIPPTPTASTIVTPAGPAPLTPPAIGVGSTPAASRSSDSESSVGGSGRVPYVWTHPKCCRSALMYAFFWSLIAAALTAASWTMMPIMITKIIKQIGTKEQTNVMVDQVQLWTTILHKPAEANYELQQSLARTFPQLLSSTPITADIFNITTLQTATGWLSGFAEVAAKHPQLRSFGMMAVLNNNETTSPSDQIYIEYIKPLNSASVDAAGEVMIQMNTADQQLLAFSPTKSLHPTNTYANGINQLFPSDVMYTDSSAAIATYLGESTSLISNHTFDLTSSATFHGFQQFLQAHQTIGYLASQPPTNFNDGLRMVAATNNLIQSSSTNGLLTFAGYSTADLNQLLAAFPIYSGDAFLISPQGGIIAATSGIAGSNLWSLDDRVMNAIRETLFREGLIVSSSTTTLKYQSGLRQVTFADDDTDGPGFYVLAQMIPGLPDNSQLSLVVQLTPEDLYDRPIQTIMLIASIGLWMISSLIILIGTIIIFGSFNRFVLTASAIRDYYSQDGRQTGRENCIILLTLVRGWKKGSRTNRPIPPRLAELITQCVPAHRPRVDEYGNVLPENPPPVASCLSRFDEFIWLNDFIERWLYEFVEGECAKHMPVATPPPRLPIEEEMKSA